MPSSASIFLAPCQTGPQSSPIELPDTGPKATAHGPGSLEPSGSSRAVRVRVNFRLFPGQACQAQLDLHRRSELPDLAREFQDQCAVGAG